MKTLLLILLLAQNPADLYKSAIADMDAERWPDAVQKFEQILREDPTHIPTEFNLAVCYTKLGRPESAEALYLKIIEQDSSIYEARFNLGVLLFQSGNGLAAEEQFQRVATMRPDDSTPVLYSARIFEKRDDKARAAESYERAVQIDPKDIDARIETINFYLNSQQLDKAYGHLQAGEQASAREFSTAVREARLRLGNALRKAEAFDKAVQVLKPLESEQNLDLALVYFDMRDFANARVHFEVLARNEPENADYLYMLGKCQMETKLYRQAVLTLRRVLQVKPDYTDAYSTLGSTYYFLEDWPNAIRMFERFSQFKPRQAIVYFLIATSYDKLGNVPQALMNYNKFLELDDGSNDARSFQARQRARTLERRPRK